MNAISSLYDFPPILDMSPSDANTPTERAGMAIIDVLWPVFAFSYIAAIPFLVAGLTIFGLKRLHEKNMDRKKVKLRKRVDELRQENDRTRV